MFYQIQATLETKNHGAGVEAIVGKYTKIKYVSNRVNNEKKSLCLLFIISQRVNISLYVQGFLFMSFLQILMRSKDE